MRSYGFTSVLAILLVKTWLRHFSIQPGQASTPSSHQNASTKFFLASTARLVLSPSATGSQWVLVQGYTAHFLLKSSAWFIRAQLIPHRGFRHAMFVKNKSGDSFYQAAHEVISFYKSQGHTVRFIRCDAGSSENDSTAGARLLQDHGVIMQAAAPGHQHQSLSTAKFRPLSRE